MGIDTRRVRAPELRGAGGWIGTEPLSLAALRGRFVILDFWTFCCVNCLHVLDELRPLEAELGDVVTVVGVHSPKFVHEADHAAVRAAVERYEVAHPVLDDPGLETWKQYAVRAWPTLVVVDPEGYVVAQASGEGHVSGLATLIRDLVPEHEQRGTLRRGRIEVAELAGASTALRFPGKVVWTPQGLLVSDTAHHQLALLSDDGAAVVRRIGSGRRGRADGTAEAASFSEPQGLCLLPTGEVVVADSVNHALRVVDLDASTVRTVAGTGEQWRMGSTRGPALQQPLSTPWDVAWWQDGVAVAMAGTHQIWHWDPSSGEVGAVAGTMGEGLRDGAAEQAYLAQPSGLAVDAEGALWIADSETSALRRLHDGVITSVVGTGLFDFGHRDGAAEQAQLQHPLGVAVAPDRTVVVADTYNGAVRRYDPTSGEVSTVTTGLAEPSDVLVVDGAIWVVESAAHSVHVVRADTSRVDAGAHRTQRPVTDVAPGLLRLEVVFTPPRGQRLDEREGPATWLTVSASPDGLLAEGAGSTTTLSRDLQLADGYDEGVLHVTARAASCDEGVEHPACHLTQQDWGIPVRLSAGGATRLDLMLRGTDA
jgi:thiol-disulfide isomerase/thioredoxin